MNEEQFAEFVRALKQEFVASLLRKNAVDARHDLEITVKRAVNQAVTETNENMALFNAGQLPFCELLTRTNMLVY